MKLPEIIEKLESTELLSERLDLLYNSVDTSESRRQTVKGLLYYFLDNERDVNEYQTMLILAKGFTNEMSISRLYDRLNEKLAKELSKDLKL